MSALFKGERSDYSLELVSDTDPIYHLRRVSDNIVVAEIIRYEAARSYRAPGNNPRGFTKSGAKRTWWKWCFTTEAKRPDIRPRFYITSRRTCINDAIQILELP